MIMAIIAQVIRVAPQMLTVQKEPSVPVSRAAGRA